MSNTYVNKNRKNIIASTTEPGIVEVLRRLIIPMLLTYSLIPLSFLVPVIDSTREPFIDLTSWTALIFFGVTETGGSRGASIVGLILLVIIVCRRGLTGVRRLVETGVLVFVILVFAGGGATINEHVIKPILKIPRPNIIYLAKTGGFAKPEMSTDSFYNLGDKESRRAPLREALEKQPPPVNMHPLIREHWIKETGYSFPSGHSFSALFFSTLFLGLGLTYFSKRRSRWLMFFYLLLPWAVFVCYSRSLLRMHTPTDISVGGLTGLILGLCAFVLIRIIMRQIYRASDN